MNMFNHRWIIILLSLMWTMQFTALASWFLHFHPRVMKNDQVFTEWLYLLKPEWDSTVYHAAIALAVIFFLGLHVYTKRYLLNSDLWQHFKHYVMIQLCVTFIILSALFKVLVYPAQPQLASAVIVVTFLINVIITLNFRKVEQYGQCIRNIYIDDRFRGVLRQFFPWMMTVGIVLAIGIPNIQAVVARNFIGEQFHHNDSFIMGPALSFLAGQHLDVDVISQYGIGFVAIFANVSEWLGGFSYESMTFAMVWATVFYYIAWFWLLRRLIKDPCILAALMCLMMKWQLLHPASYPLVFTYGSQTPVRFLYDVIFFWFLWAYWQRPNFKLLIAVAMTAGFGVYYFTSEGLYAAAAFIGMLIVTMLNKQLRVITQLTPLRVIVAILIIPLMATLLLAMTVGKDILSSIFWQNVGEFIQYFMNGFGLEPMTKTLIAKQFSASAIGFFIPLVYLLTLLVVGARVFLGQAPSWQMWIVTLCLYGLGTYHYYIARSVVTSYYTVSIPYVIILGFWCSVVIAKLPIKLKNLTRWGVLIMAVGALVTTHQWISYPNFLNLSRHPMVDPLVTQKLPNGQPYFNHLFRDQVPGLLREDDFISDDELIGFYKQSTDFSVDVSMIKALTDPQDEVAMIASFEIEYLRQAQRKPFFYYFPLVISHPLEATLIPAVSIYTRSQLKKVLTALESQKPKVIFIEKGLANIQLTKELTYRYPSTIELLMYVYQHYELLKEGKHLIALRRR